jgi:tRNA(fMet)-specific endonuclease VapC
MLCGQEALRERFNSLAGELCISSITLAELHFGAEKSTRLESLQTIEQLSARLEVLPFPPKAATHLGQLSAHVERLGQPVGPLDLLIGAHARAEGIIVATNNLREFQRLPGVQVQNWL